MNRETLRSKLSLGSVPKKLFLRYPSVVKILPSIKKVFPYTMVGIEGLYHAYRVVKKAQNSKLRGSIVEVGCWNGGCGTFMATHSDRETWLFDSFEGLPEFGAYDISPKGKTKPGSHKALKENVLGIINLLGLKNIHVVGGWVEDTIVKRKDEIKDIAILRIDLDVYASTKFVLEALYDQVVEGGYIILDDYSAWSGSRKAVYEFFAEKGIAPRIESSDFLYPVYFRK